MLACYLVRGRNLDASDAVEFVRRLRPGSIEVSNQERLVKQFAASLKE